MEQNIIDQNIQSPGYRQQLPNATATLVLGILSIVFCWCYGIIGTALGIIALAISSKSVKLYNENPSAYDGFNNLKAGRIMSIIGLILSGLFLLYIIIIIAAIGTAALSFDQIFNNLK
jgi:hypothetical protein